MPLIDADGRGTRLGHGRPRSRRRTELRRRHHVRDRARRGRVGLILRLEASTITRTEGFRSARAEQHAPGIAERLLCVPHGGGNGVATPTPASRSSTPDVDQHLRVAAHRRRQRAEGYSAGGRQAIGTERAVNKPSPVVAYLRKITWPLCSPPSDRATTVHLFSDVRGRHAARARVMPRSLHRTLQADVATSRVATTVSPASSPRLVQSDRRRRRAPDRRRSPRRRPTRRTRGRRRRRATRPASAPSSNDGLGDDLRMRCPASPSLMFRRRLGVERGDVCAEARSNPGRDRRQPIRSRNRRRPAGPSERRERRIERDAAMYALTVAAAGRRRRDGARSARGRFARRRFDLRPRSRRAASVPGERRTGPVVLGRVMRRADRDTGRRTQVDRHVHDRAEWARRR